MASSALTATATAASAAPKTASKARFVAADIMRVLAIVLMVQGHVFYEVAGPAVKGASWYGWHGYVHGFTAPIFLFVAGLVFGLAALRRWDEHSIPGPTAYKRLERFALLVLLGYVIRLPVFNHQAMLPRYATSALEILKFDALQQIGLTLLACQLLALVCRRERVWGVVLSIMTVAMVTLAPFVWRLDLSELPVGIQMAFQSKKETGSLFPLFPWSAFVFAGAATAYWQRRVKHRTRMAWLMTALGFASWWIGHSMTKTGFNPFGEHNYWKTSPWFFLLRIGVIWMLLGGFSLVRRDHSWRRVALGASLVAGSVGLWVVSHSINYPGLNYLLSGRSMGRLSVVIGFVGCALLLAKPLAELVRTLPARIATQNSLIIYVVHLYVLYRINFVGTTLKRAAGGSLSLFEAIVAVILVFLLSFAMAWLFDGFKKSCGPHYPKVRRVLWALAIAAFFLPVFG